jgi:hypothetical protein
MTTFAEHWLIGNTLLGAPKHVKIGLADKSEITQAIFDGWRTTLQTQQNAVQTALTATQIARGNVNVMKTALLQKFGLFTTQVDGYYQGTGFYAARPYAPTFNDGKENFLRPLGAMMNLWAEMNADTAPAGVTLPLVLGDETDQGAFASALSALIFAFALMEKKELSLAVARGKRNVTQAKAYETMRQYREVAPGKYHLHPEMIETLPRLTPLPGHTPARVNASAVLEGQNQSKIIYDASADSMLAQYELRATAGGDYNDEDAVLVATNEPGAPREFVTPFGLTQPGAKVAFKVFVVLTTGNEAGSAEMVVQRPVSLPLAA